MLIDSIKIKPISKDSYPFNLSIFESEVFLDTNRFVTIFVGENGCGKSSLLKLIQVKLKLTEITIPNSKIKHEVDQSPVEIKPSLGKLKGFFFESIAFINYIEYIQNEITNAKDEISRIDVEYKNKSEYTKSLAKSPYTKTIYELSSLYSKDLSMSSHGESFLHFFSSRIKDNQIYLLDEPETPLSTQNQLTLMAMILDATKRGCQFMIATHSPIISAIPSALIYEIKDNNIVQTKYEDIKSVQLLKQFINNKDQFLKHFYLED